MTSYKAKLALLGAVAPIVVVLVIELFDERVPDIVSAALVFLYGAVLFPGMLLPVRGPWTLGLICFLWMALGLLIGAWIDKRRERSHS